MKLPKQLLQECFDHGIKCYPEEACGFISGTAGETRKFWEVHRMKNIIDQLHQQNPDKHPRSSRNGFMIDPLKQIRLERKLEQRGHQICVIYHSHPDVGAYFSCKDREDALWNGHPRFPDVLYLVCGIHEAKQDGAVVLEFDHQTKQFKCLRLC